MLGSSVLDVLVATSEPGKVVHVRDWSALHQALVREHPASVALVELGGTGEQPLANFWKLLERYPSATVVPVVTAGPRDVPRLRAMLEAGVSEIINLAIDGVAVAQRRLRGAHARPFKRKLETELTRFIQADARVVLSAAAEVAVSGGGAADVASKFTVRPRTLVRWCARTALPEPRRLQAWMRVLLASQLLDDPGRTMWDVAVACGYTTDRSLRRIIKGLLKIELDVRVLRRTGVFTTAMQSFNAELRRLREERRRMAAVQPGKVVVPMQASEVSVSGASPA